MPNYLPLKGIRVIDASRVLAGPYCAQILADLGATVLKIEHPVRGDDTRSWGPPFAHDMSSYFASCNRGKQSIGLDLHNKHDLHHFHKLLRSSDVLIENFKTNSLKKLGLDAQNLRKKLPHLITCSISGYGRIGAWRDVPGYDFTIQALSGLMDITGVKDGPPTKVGVAVTDVLTSLYATTAILAALYHRQKAKISKGVHIDLALLDCAIASQVNILQSYLDTEQKPKRYGNAHPQIVPYEAFKAKDKWFILAIGNDIQWQRLVEIKEFNRLNAESYANNSKRVKHRVKITKILREILVTKPAKYWLSMFSNTAIPSAPILNYQELKNLKPVQEKRLFRKFKGDPRWYIKSPFVFNGIALPDPIPPPKKIGRRPRA